MEISMAEVDVYEYFIDHGFSEQAYENLPEDKKLEYLDIAMWYDRQKDAVEILVFSYIEFLCKNGYFHKQDIENAVDVTDAIHKEDKELLISYLYGEDVYGPKSREVFISRYRETT